MSLRILSLLLGLLLLAVVFSTINSHFSEKKNRSVSKTLLLGLSKVLSDIAIGLIIAVIPTVILLNCLKPQPEDVMPVFIYDGTYSEILDSIDDSMAESLIVDCSEAIKQSADAENYFDRACLYFKTGNLDLAHIDLQKCIELEETWMYYYDLGVVYGYRLDYSSAIESFEKALSMDIPFSERGLVINTLTMIESYFDEWIYSLLK